MSHGYLFLGENYWKWLLLFYFIEYLMVIVELNHSTILALCCNPWKSLITLIGLIWNNNSSRKHFFFSSSDNSKSQMLPLFAAGIPLHQCFCFDTDVNNIIKVLWLIHHNMKILSPFKGDSRAKRSSTYAVFLSEPILEKNVIGPGFCICAIHC